MGRLGRPTKEMAKEMAALREQERIALEEDAKHRLYIAEKAKEKKRLQKERIEREKEERKAREDERKANIQKKIDRLKGIEEHAKDFDPDIRKTIISQMGGKCVCCGYRTYLSALEFHHAIPSTKSAPISGLVSRYLISPTAENLKALKIEARKCVILCSNCHQAFHAGELKLHFYRI